MINAIIGTIITIKRKSHRRTSHISVIAAAVRSLLDKDLITTDKGVYMAYAPFFPQYTFPYGLINNKNSGNIQ